MKQEDSYYIDQFIGFLQKTNWDEVYKPLPKSTINGIREKLFVKKVKEGEVILPIGEICSEAYFVAEGLCIVFTEDKRKNKGKIEEEISICVTRFSQAGRLLMCPMGFYSQTASIEGIKVLEDTVLVGFYKRDLDEFYKKYIGFNVVGRKLTEFYYCLAENRAYVLRRHDSIQKIAWFNEYYSDLIKKDIDDKYIASFLGLSREHYCKNKYLFEFAERAFKKERENK